MVDLDAALSPSIMITNSSYVSSFYFLVLERFINTTFLGVFLRPMFSAKKAENRTTKAFSSLATAT